MLEESQFVQRAVDLGRRTRLPGDARERRTHVRRPYHGWIAFLPEPTDGLPRNAVSMRCCDLSAAGLSALCGRTFPAETVGAVLLQRADGQHVILRALVVHCRCRGRMDYTVGLQFDGEAEQVSVDDFRDARGALPELGDIAARRAG